MKNEDALGLPGNISGLPPETTWSVNAALTYRTFAAAAASPFTKELIQRVAEKMEAERAKREQHRRKVTRELAAAMRPVAREIYRHCTELHHLRPDAIYDSLVKHGEAQNFDEAVFSVARYLYRNVDDLDPKLKAQIDEFLKLPKR